VQIPILDRRRDGLKEGLNYREEIVQRLKALKAGTVLDAGTGAGTMTQALTIGLDLKIVSIDINKRVFTQVSGKVEKKRVDFLACDFAHLPFRENVFVGVVCDLVISTSKEWKPSRIYAEFKRTLRPRSSLFITDYYPERSSTTKEALLASKTSNLYKKVMKAKGTMPKKSVPPRSTDKQLRKAGFATVEIRKIKANEPQEWKRRVFEEYDRNMKVEISNLDDLKLQTDYMKRLEELKSKIGSNGRINWAWGVNYLVQATK